MFQDKNLSLHSPYLSIYGGACDVMVIVVINGDGNLSSLIIVRQTRLFNIGMATSLGEGKL